MRLVFSFVFALAALSARPAFADWTCSAERTAPEARVEVQIDITDQGAVSGGKIFWAPRRTSPMGPKPYLVYRFDGAALQSARLEGFEVRNAMYVLRDSPVRIFYAVQVDRGPLTAQEWRAYAGRSNAAPTGMNRSDYVDQPEVFDPTAAANTGLFAQIQAQGVRVLRVHQLDQNGRQISSGEYDLATKMSSSAMSVQALASAREMAADYRQRCKQNA